MLSLRAEQANGTLEIVYFKQPAIFIPITATNLT